MADTPPTLTWPDQVQALHDLCFSKVMFGLASDDAFAVFLDGCVTGQAGILSGRIGSRMSAADEPAKTNVAEALKNLSAAELIQRRINFVLGNVVANGAELDTRNEQRQRADYQAAAERFISQLVNDATADGSGFASGVVITEGLTPC